MKKIQIGLPCSPSRRVSAETMKVTEILISYGGGMGGSNQTFYVTKINGNEITLITGEVIKLNPNFIVMEKSVVLVKQVIDTTDHSNYHVKRFKKTIVTEYHKIDYNKDFEFTNESHDKNSTIRVHVDVDSEVLK